MSNRNSPATPTQSNGGDMYGGLTKLEYAVIHLCAGGQSISGGHNHPDVAVHDAIRKANAIFDMLKLEEGK